MKRCALMWSLGALCLADPSSLQAQKDPKVARAVSRGLDWLSKQQHRKGYWQTNNGRFRVAMTALAANALLCEGSTTTRGKYSRNIRRAVDFLVGVSQENGLIGYRGDYHYMYGHGFSMLFLSQVYGEEEDADRREELRDVLTRAVRFCGEAQTPQGGWGYVSAKDGNNFDEGSTCITQVQGLRACRNAGIPVPKQIIDRANKYIRDCTILQGDQRGGVVYSYASRRSNRGRPAITAAAVACLFNAGDYESEYVQMLTKYCEKFVWPAKGSNYYSGHWHYTHYYYAQVMYRRGGLGKDEKEKAANEKLWEEYRSFITKKILREQSANGAWIQGSSYGGVYATALNCTILQLENNYLPIYQR